MLKITFSEEDVQALQQARFEHPEARVRLKMEVLYLKSQDFAHQEIAYLCGISTSTVRRYLQAYNERGLAHLQNDARYRPHNDLVEYRAVLEASFRERPPTSVAEARARIKELTGLERKPTQVRACLRALGMRPRKVGSVPAKADAVRQEKFRQEQLEPRLEEAKAGQRAVFFLDAAHFVYGPRVPFGRGMVVVLCAAVGASSCRTAATQCVSCAPCDYPATDNRDQSHLYKRDDCLRVAAPLGSGNDQAPSASDGGVRQRTLSAVCCGAILRTALED